MRFSYDHDIHIHTKISGCSNDPLQTAENILQYAKKNNLKVICTTDHFWDASVDIENGVRGQGYDRLSSNLPLPKAEGIKFMFGCETDLNKYLTLGISRETFEKFDFVIIPTTHLHLEGFTIEKGAAPTAEERAKMWVERFDKVLSMDLPFEKIGIAHLTCNHIAKPREKFLKALSLIPDDTYRRIFTKCAELGCGIELNSTAAVYTEEEKDTVLRPYRIAKECGCKFYLGSDAHHPDRFEKAPEIFSRVIDDLNLEESDKFRLAKP